MTFLRLSLRLALLSAVICLVALGCSRVSPVAPAGTTVTLSANPAFIATAGGRSMITAIVLKPNGSPVVSGTVVRFTADLGSIDPEATTNSSGIASATLRGDGRLGKATVSAFVGGSTTATTLAVNIGSTPLAKSITLQVEPPAVTIDGGNLKLLAVVRDATGAAVVGAGVTFNSPTGVLRSGGNIVNTNGGGTATDVLTVTAADLANIAGSFSVTATTVGADGSPLTATFSIHINTGQPIAAFTTVQVPGTLTIQFVNQSTPVTGLTYSWQLGDGTSSQDQSPSHPYASAGTYLVILTVTNTQGQSSTATKNVVVNPV